MTDITAIPTANLGFSTTLSAKKLTRVIATMTDNRKLQYGLFARQSRNLWQSVAVAIVLLISVELDIIEYPEFGVGIYYLDASCHSSRDVIISGFGGHIDIPGCRSLLYLFANIISHLIWSYTPVSLEF